MSKAWQIYAMGPAPKKKRHFTVAADDKAQARSLVEGCAPGSNIISCSALGERALELLDIRCPAVLEWKPINEAKTPYVSKVKPKKH